MSLPAQVVVNAHDDDDELVVRIGRTCYQTRVVGCLSRLHMADDQATTVPIRAFAYGVLTI